MRAVHDPAAGSVAVTMDASSTVIAAWMTNLGSTVRIT